MDAPCRRPPTPIALAFLAIPFAAACSLQNFDYLTRGGTTAGDGGGSAPDATASSDAGALTDGPDDATFSDSASAQDASTADDRAEASDAPSAVSRDGTIEGGGLDAAAEASPDTGSSGPINYIVNPNFSASTLSGWTIVPSSDAQTYVITQAPIGSAYTPQGQAYELATYSANAPFTADISQTITGLPDGVYTFSAWFNRGPNNVAEIYARGCWGGGSAPDGGNALDGAAEVTAPIPITSSTGWEEVSIAGINVSAGSCQVGLYVDAAASNWLNADGFTFEADVADAD